MKRRTKQRSRTFEIVDLILLPEMVSYGGGKVLGKGKAAQNKKPKIKHPKT